MTLIRCPLCEGKGAVNMTGKCDDALKLLRKQKKEVTGAELARLDGCTGPAMNNRLASLERFGLATSRRYGRMRLYTAL